MEIDDEILTQHNFSSADTKREENDTLFVEKITQGTINDDLFNSIRNFTVTRKDCLNDRIKEDVKIACRKFNVTESQKMYEKELRKYEDLAAQCDSCKKNAAEIKSILNETIQKEEEVIKEINELQERLESCEEPLSKLILRKSDCSESYTNTIPQLKKEFDMLRATLPIRFDHTAPDSKVRGYILKTKNGTKDLTPFDLDADSNSRQFIANFLWHQLENSEPFFH